MPVESQHVQVAELRVLERPGSQLGLDLLQFRYEVLACLVDDHLVVVDKVLIVLRQHRVLAQVSLPVNQVPVVLRIIEKLQAQDGNEDAKAKAGKNSERYTYTNNEGAVSYREEQSR